MARLGSFGGPRVTRPEARALLRQRHADGEEPPRIGFGHWKALPRHPRGGIWSFSRVTAAIAVRGVGQIAPVVGFTVAAALVADKPGLSALFAVLAVISGYLATLLHRRWPWTYPLVVEWTRIGTAPTGTVSHDYEIREAQLSRARRALERHGFHDVEHFRSGPGDDRWIIRVTQVRRPDHEQEVGRVLEGAGVGFRHVGSSRS